MLRFQSCGVVLAVLAGAMCVPGSALSASAPAAAAKPARPGRAQTGEQRALLDKYCVGCHNEQRKAQYANLAFDTLSLDDLGAHSDVWERTIKKLRIGAMPPTGMPRPDKAAQEGFVSWLETSLDDLAVRAPNGTVIGSNIVALLAGTGPSARRGALAQLASGKLLRDFV